MKKTFKRFLAMVLCVAMILTAAPLSGITAIGASTVQLDEAVPNLTWDDCIIDKDTNPYTVRMGFKIYKVDTASGEYELLADTTAGNNTLDVKAEPGDVLRVETWAQTNFHTTGIQLTPAYNNAWLLPTTMSDYTTYASTASYPLKVDNVASKIIMDEAYPKMVDFCDEYGYGEGTFEKPVFINEALTQVKGQTNHNAFGGLRTVLPNNWQGTGNTEANWLNTAAEDQWGNSIVDENGHLIYNVYQFGIVNGLTGAEAWTGFTTILNVYQPIGAFNLTVAEGAEGTAKLFYPESSYSGDQTYFSTKFIAYDYDQVQDSINIDGNWDESMPQVCACGLSKMYSDKVTYSDGTQTDKNYIVENATITVGDYVTSEYSGTCGDNLTWTLNAETGVLNITGTGAMDNYTGYDRPWEDYKDIIKSVVINEGVKSIGDYAFYNCGSLTNIKISDSIKSIGNSSFMKCHNLSEIIIPETVTSIGNWAFSFCESLTNIAIAHGVTSIGDYVFSDCTGLQSITIPCSVTNISKSALNGCKTLKDIYYSGSRDQWYSAFKGALPTGVSLHFFTETICDYSFVEAAKAKIPADLSLYTPASVESLNNALSDVVYNLPVKLQSKVDAYAAAIDKAVENLVPKPDKNPLAEYIQVTKSLVEFDYTPASWTAANIAYAIAKAQAVYDNENADITAVNQALALLKAATAKLAKKGDKAALSAAIATLPEREEKYCTKETWANYKTALAKAEEVMSDVNATQAAVDSAEAELLAAISSIVYNTCGDDLVWEISEDGVLTITGTGAMNNWSSYSSVPWYSYRSKIKTVNIESGVTTIGNSAFEDCTSLTNVTIGNSVTTIGDTAFYYCTSLKSVTIPDSVTTIGDYAFDYCTSLTNVTIGNSVTTIGDSAFSSCDSLTSVTIGNSVTIIGESAFEWCSTLTSVTIPDSVTTIGDWAFTGCDSLTSIIVDAGNKYYSSDSYGVLFNKDKTMLVQYPAGKTDYTIPDSVTTIGNYEFRFCHSLTSITIPDSVKTIGNYAFNDCESLTYIYYLGFKRQWESAFKGTLPSGITVYYYEENVCDYSALDAAMALVPTEPSDAYTAVTWKAYADALAEAKAIERDMVADEAGKNQAHINAAAQALTDAYNALKLKEYCDYTQLQNTVDLCQENIASAEYYDAEAYANWQSALATAAALLEAELLEKTSENQAIVDNATSALRAAYDALEVSYVDLTELEEAIESCNASVSEPECYTANSWARYEAAFNAAKLAAADYKLAPDTQAIRDTINEITAELTAAYSALELLAFDRTALEAAIATLPEREEKYCTEESWAVYKAALAKAEEVMADADATQVAVDSAEAELLAAISAIEYNTCGDDIVWEISDDGVLNITGTGAMTNWDSYKSVPWYSERSKIKTVNIESGVTTIGDYAFCNCTNLTSVTIGNSVTTIGEAAFYRCYSLTSVTIPDSVTTIGDVAFGVCSGLTNVTIPDSVTTIGSGAFSGCTGLTGVVIPESVTEYGEGGVFTDSTNIESFTIPAAVASNEKFATLTKLVNLNITGDTSALKIPSKITGVMAVGGHNSISVSWNKASEVNSTSYRILKKAENESEFRYLTTVNGRDTLTYIDYSVIEGEQYSYAVVTVDKTTGIVSPVSDTVVSTPAIDTEAPIVSKILPASYTYLYGTKTITVNVTDNIEPTGVILSYSADDGNTWVQLGEDKAAPFTFNVDSTAIDDGVILVRAVAYDAKGNMSEPKTNTYSVDNSGPEKVTGVATVEVYSSLITLKWNDVNNGDRACFILQQKTENGFTTINSSISRLGYTLSGLLPGTEYTFRVAAVDSRGNIGEYSDEYSVKTPIDTFAPRITQLLPRNVIFNSSVTLKATAEDDSAIKSVDIQVSTNLRTWKTIHTEEFTSYSRVVTCSYTVNAADYSDGSIYLRAIAEDMSGNLSDSSDEAGLVEYVVDKTAPASPLNLIAGGYDGGIYISWSQGAEKDLGTYSLYRATAENGPYSLIKADLQVLDFYDTTAKRDTVYYYKLRVKDQTGNFSDFTEAVSAKVADDIQAPVVSSVLPKNGSAIGKGYNTVSAFLTDNNALDSVVIEYKINDAEDYSVLKQFNGISSKSYTAKATMPTDTLVDGDKIHVRVYATDISGFVSEYSAVYTYRVDAVAPSVNDPKATITENKVTISWSGAGETDIAGYKVYRVAENSSEKFVGSRAYSATNSYSLIDYLDVNKDSSFAYRIEAFDSVGNSASFFTNSVFFDYKEPESSGDSGSGGGDEYVNKAPTAVIDGLSVMEIGVEEYFDAGKSTDDSSIVSYFWDFGDGTTSTEIKPVKKYSEAGEYLVILTVTDDEGVASTAQFIVKVAERASLGVLEVLVVDENGKPVKDAEVAFGYMSSDSKSAITNSSGKASYTMMSGELVIAAYKTGYLPDTKTVTVLSNAKRTVTLTLIKGEIVTGEFEVKRMTLDEVKAAGIHINDPENQHFIKADVTLYYGSSPIPISYIRDDNQIHGFTIGDEDFDYTPEPKVVTISGGGGGGGTDRKFDIKYIPNNEGEETVAVLEMPVGASFLKEFFDVRLHIVNNATAAFCLVDNEVHLNLPDGLSIAQDSGSNWYKKPDVYINSIRGQETKTVAWILRGDVEGEYNLTADYTGTLAGFSNGFVSTKFETNEPIKVYGLSGVNLIVEANDTIDYGAFYFNIGVKNTSPIDIYNPNIDFDGRVEDIFIKTQEDYLGSFGEGSGGGFRDTAINSVLINVKYVSADGKVSYIPFNYGSDGKVTSAITMLAPGESFYYEYVVYDAIDYDGIAYFEKNATAVLEGYTENVEVNIKSFDLYNVDTVVDKLMSGQALNQGALNNLIDDETYYYWNEATGTASNDIGRFLYNCSDIIFNFNWDVLSKEDQKTYARDLIATLVTSQRSVDYIDEKVNDKYVKAIKNYLGLIEKNLTAKELNLDDFYETHYTEIFKYEYEYGLVMTPDTFISYERLDVSYQKIVERKFNATEAAMQESINLLDSMTSNYKLLDKLAQAASNGGTESLGNAIMSEITKVVGAGAMTYLNSYLTPVLKDNNSFLSCLGESCELVGNFVDGVVINGIKAYNETVATQAVYSMVQANASNEYMMDFLDEIIENCGENTAENKYNKILVEEAKELKAIAESKEEINYGVEFWKSFLDESLQDLASSKSKDAAKFILNKLPKKVNMIYTIAGIGFNMLDYKAKWGERYKAEDSLDIVESLSTVFNNDFSESMNRFNDDPTKENAIAVAVSLSYLVQLREAGEDAYIDFIKNVEEDFIPKFNELTGSDYEDVSDFAGQIKTRIYKARDELFSKQNTTPLEVPPAPAVSFNYNELTTDQSFDSSYEYCLADGEWRSCTGSPIGMSLKTHAQVLRVRKASGNGHAAGEITTITVYAQRELSKNISVRYDNDTYYFDNLSAAYTYECCPTDKAYSSVYSFTNRVKGGSNANCVADYADYIALRAMPNSSKYETYSKVLVVPVRTRQPLTVVTSGNGSVTTDREDKMYFNGEDIYLTAVPDANAEFKGWYVNGELVSSNLNYILEMSSWAEITARFSGDIKPDGVSVNLLTKSGKYVDLDTVYAGTVGKLNATVTPQNATDKSVIWQVSDSSVASVTKEGIITFHSAGNVVITAMLSNGITENFEVKVLANNLTKLELGSLPYKLTYTEADSLDLSGLEVFATYADGSVAKTENYTVSGFDNLAGEKTIVLTAGNYTVRFNVNVVHQPSWQHKSDATCSVPGQEAYVCSFCGETLETRETATAEHSCEWVVTHEATPAENGLKEYICKVCKTSFDSEEIVFCVHSFESVVTNPTCTQDGFTTHICSECGYEKVDNFVDSTGHKYDSKTIAPTCDDGGYTVYECTVCSDSYISDNTEPLGHSYKSTVVKATCITDGYTLHECETCGDEYSDNKTNKLGHDYESVITAPTCESGGITTYTCKVCSESYITDEIDPLGHSHESNVTKEPTCEEDGVRTFTCHCGDSYTETIKADGHTKGEWETTVEPGCENEGAKVKKCTVCGETVETGSIPAIGHDYKAEVTKPTCTTNGYTTHTCSVCGDTYTDNETQATGHSHESKVTKEPTCEEDGVRTFTCHCGDSYTEAIKADGHTKGEWETTVEPGCENEGAKVKKCTVCGETVETGSIPAIGHDYKAEVTKPTCTTDGYTTHTCSVCGDAYTDNETQATDHSHESNVTKEPTCEEDGVRTFTCHCGDSYTEAIKADGHTKGEWEYIGGNEYAKLCTVCEDKLESKIVTVDMRFNSENVNRKQILNKSTATVTATVTDNFVNDLVFASSDNSTVSVDASGNVVANNIGKATITVTIKGTDISDSIEVEVLPRDFTVTWNVNGKQTKQTVKEEAKLTPNVNTTLKGYRFIGWDKTVPATMPAENLTFTAQYELIVNQLKIKDPSIGTVKYGETLVMHAEVSELPDGWSIQWTIEGNGFDMVPSDDSLTCKITSVENGNATVKATVVDENGEAVLDANGNEMSDSKQLKSNASFWQKIVSFFKNLFRINRIISE